MDRQLLFLLALGFATGSPGIENTSLVGSIAVQESLIDRPEAPRREDFETDSDGDGVPDLWYNRRDAALVDDDGVDGATFLRFEAAKPSRPARISRAFGVDGRETAALIVGLWLRRGSEPLLPGERIGEEPLLLLDLLDENLRNTARGTLGPWLNLPEGRWVRHSTRIAVPPETRDAILTVGLLGATGTLDIDGLTIQQVPVDGIETTNLIVNGGFELGGSDPAHWILEGEARRVHPGDRSSTALELAEAEDRAIATIGLPADEFRRISVRMRAAGTDLRGSGGALAYLFFLNSEGRQLSGRNGVAQVIRWSGTFPWRTDQAIIPVPTGAAIAVLQLEKRDRRGEIRIDRVEVLGDRIDRSGVARWRPFHLEGSGADWPPFSASEGVEAGSALDASHHLEAPAGSHGFVTHRDNQLQFEDGTPIRFFGVSLTPSLAFGSRSRIDALIDRLARSGVNLVRIDGLDAPLGPGGSLIDDAQDDTSTLDPLSVDDFDYFVDALKSRGIYLCIELQGQARFRSGDGVVDGRVLPPGGGPAAAFDPQIRERARRIATELLTHQNPKTGLALKDDPVLAWITLVGECSLFDLNDSPGILPAGQSEVLQNRINDLRSSSGQSSWEAVEASQWGSLAEELQRIGVRVPIAGSSHWRRDEEFVEAQQGNGLDLVDDRLYWSPPSYSSPDRRSLLRQRANDLLTMAQKKDLGMMPYVVGQYASYTEGAWALPFEGADLLLATQIARTEGWGGLVRRAIGPHPEDWGAAASGTSGGRDVYIVPEVINGNPQVFGLLPHSASLLLQRSPAVNQGRRDDRDLGWDFRRGILAIDTASTQGLAGWTNRRPSTLSDLTIKIENRFGVIIASSTNSEPIARADRLLITAIAQVEPTGLRWVDHWHREVADPGRPPLRLEPIQGNLTWRQDRPVTAYALDVSGRRIKQIPVQRTSEGFQVRVDSNDGTIHWELVRSLD